MLITQDLFFQVSDGTNGERVGGKKPVNVMYTEKVVWDSLSFLAVSEERALTFSSGET